MNDMNKIIVSGRVVQDRGVETHGTTEVLRFTIANNQSYKKGDEWIDNVSFFECVFLGRIPQRFKDGIFKGQFLVIEGTLKQSRYQGKDGMMKSSVSIHVLSAHPYNLIPNGLHRQINSTAVKETFEADDVYEEIVPF